MCVLRAFGTAFDVDRFVEKTSLPNPEVRHKGSYGRLRRKSKRKWSHTGLTVSVSRASWSSLKAQVADAERFLVKHNREIARLSRSKGLEHLVLDFPIYLRIGMKLRGSIVAAQSDRFPASLVRAAGKLGVGLELTVYG
jgi:hypothetical protein